eukprot:7389433-Prymnesium_polylepis.1
MPTARRGAALTRTARTASGAASTARTWGLRTEGGVGVRRVRRFCAGQHAAPRLPIKMRRRAPPCARLRGARAGGRRALTSARLAAAHVVRVVGHLEDRRRL